MLCDLERSQAEPFDGREDVIGGFVPSEGFGIFVDDDVNPGDKMDGYLRHGTSHRRSAGPTDPPRQHSGNERRKLSFEPEPGATGESQQITTKHIGPRANAPWNVLAIWRPRAPGRTPNKPPTDTQTADRHAISTVADFCAATWLVFTPPLTRRDITQERRRSGRPRSEHRHV